MLPVGSLVNAGAIIIGSVVGLSLRDRFPERMRILIYQALGLCVMVIGLQMAFKMTEPLLVIFSLILGGMFGEIVRIDALLERLAQRVKKLARSSDGSFTDGFVSASLMYCIGSMAIIGAFDEGLRGDPSLLFTKAMLDGFISIPLASTMGIGVLFAFAPVLVYQVGLTLLAGALQPFFTDQLIAQITAVGGVLIMGIAFDMLGLLTIRLSNLLPSLLAAVLLSLLL
ncbi:MAG: DUF554 domain-containing protein [Desulfovibrionaceae bacterium]|jgi:uncharacterized membrane protein YqgA involved in biofilm formation